MDDNTYTPLHIGNLIKETFRKAPKKRTIEWLAEQLNCQPNNIYNIFRRQTIDTELLMKFSEVLHHDFFADLSKDFRDKRIAKNKISAQEILKEHKTELYRNMMEGISRLVWREIKRMQMDVGVTEWASLNHNDVGEASPFPPELYRVVVLGKEDYSTLPHIHLLSLAEKFEVRMAIESGDFLSVKIKGKKGTKIDTAALTDMTKKWLDMPSMLNPLLTNRDMALTIFRSINPPADLGAKSKTANL